MPIEPKLKQQAGQTLSETAQNPGRPKNMAKILGVAGQGLWDFLSESYDKLVPQTAEEWALEGSPAGKAIGLIPPKYIQPFVKRLREMIEAEKGWSPQVQQAAWEAVDRNPRIAAHVDEIRPYRVGDTNRDPGAIGDYTALDKSAREYISSELPMDVDKYFNYRLDNGQGPRLGGEIRLDPEKATYGSVFEPPAKVAEHEITHAAQDVWNPNALGEGQRYQTYEYGVNPFEVGANATADPMGGNYWARLERQLNARGIAEALGTPERAKMLRDMNRTMANQGRQIQLDPKTQMLRIVTGR